MGKSTRAVLWIDSHPAIEVWNFHQRLMAVNRRWALSQCPSKQESTFNLNDSLNHELKSIMHANCACENTSLMINANVGSLCFFRLTGWEKSETGHERYGSTNNGRRERQKRRGDEWLHAWWPNTNDTKIMAPPGIVHPRLPFTVHVFLAVNYRNNVTTRLTCNTLILYQINCKWHVCQLAH